ncbi:MAG: TonB-dependent receptor [Pseudomonadota bacterium]
MNSRTGKRLFTTLLCAASVGTLGVLATPAMAQTGGTQQVTIEAQPLDAAILEIARRYGVTITAPDTLVGGKRAPRVSGSLTAEQALSRTLAGSGLTYKRSGNGRYVIVRAAAARPQPQPIANSQQAPDEDAIVRTNPIVVYGQKREQDLLETTDSVAVYDEKTVRDLTIRDTTDIFRFTPNVSQNESGEGTFSIRGASAIGGTFSTGVSNTSALYFDGIFQSNLGIEAGPNGLFDIGQVEIYRGPQSTLQGRNALSGAVVIRSNDPSYDYDITGLAQISEFNTQRLALAGGGAIVDDVIAFRLSADYFSTDGFITNADGRDDQDADESLTLRGKLLVEPSYNLKVIGTYIYSFGNASTGLGSGIVQGPDFFARRVNQTNITQLDIDTHNAALLVTYEASDRVTIVSETTYTNARETAGNQFPLTPAEIASGFSDTGSDAEDVWTSDLRVNFESDRLDLLIGAYYFNREQEFDRNLTGVFVAPNNLFQTNFNIIEAGSQTIENFAFYADGSYALTDKLKLLFGVRYDNENFNTDQQESTLIDPEFPQFDVVSNLGAVLVADTSFDAFLPKFGLQYDLTANQRIAFVAQRGYRPGGADLTLGGTPFAFGSESLWNYELSYRMQSDDGKISLNANIFYSDWNDQQIFVTPILTGTGNELPNELEGRTFNAGQSRLWGFEGQLTYSPEPATRLFLSVGYNNTEITDLEIEDPDFEIPGGLSGLIGNEFSQAPELQLSLGAVHRASSGFFASVDASYTSSAFSDIENLAANRLDDYFLVNARLGWEFDNFAVYGFVRNAFDEEYAFRINVNDFGSGGLGSATIGAPQVFGAELSFDF